MIKDLDEGRKIVLNSFPVKTFEAENTADWEKAYETFKKYSVK